MRDCGNNPEFTCEQEFCNCGKRENTGDNLKKYTEAEMQKVLCEQIEATFQAIMEEIHFDQELYDELHTIARNSKV